MNAINNITGSMVLSVTFKLRRAGSFWGSWENREMLWLSLDRVVQFWAAWFGFPRNKKSHQKHKIYRNPEIAPESRNYPRIQNPHRIHTHTTHRQPWGEQNFLQFSWILPDLLGSQYREFWENREFSGRIEKFSQFFSTFLPATFLGFGWHNSRSRFVMSKAASPCTTTTTELIQAMEAVLDSILLASRSDTSVGCFIRSWRSYSLRKLRRMARPVHHAH